MPWRRVAQGPAQEPVWLVRVVLVLVLVGMAGYLARQVWFATCSPDPSASRWFGWLLHHC